MPDLAQSSSGEPDFASLELDEQIRRVHAALEDEVYQALAMDGGGMELMDIRGYEVLISYYGACGNCHISATGTLGFIQQTLQEKVDGRITVTVV